MVRPDYFNLCLYTYLRVFNCYVIGAVLDVKVLNFFVFPLFILPFSPLVV